MGRIIRTKKSKGKVAFIMSSAPESFLKKRKTLEEIKAKRAAANEEAAKKKRRQERKSLNVQKSM